MRKLIICLNLFFTSFTCLAQLNPEATVMKESYPEAYNQIRRTAIEKWNDDHEMIVYNINEEATAWVEYLGLLKNADNDVLFKAVEKWVDKRDKEKFYSSLKSDGTNFMNVCRIEWGMVVYEYKNQIEAKNAY